VLLFCSHVDVQFADRTYQDAGLLQVYLLNSRCRSFTDFWAAADGKGVSPDQLNELALASPKFNHHQYAIEHGSPNHHLSVQAGAGTGKTTVMIERIMYLIRAENVPLDRIAMITFTNEAAQNMRRKIYQKLFQYYEATKLPFYLENIEQLPRMRISTIHAFSKHLIHEIGAGLGYGRNVQIRTLGLERRRIIEKSLDSYFSKDVDAGVGFASIFKGLRFHERVQLVEKFWNKMEKLGLVSDEIDSLDWGRASGNAKHFQEFFEDVFPHIEREFHDYKINDNVVSLEDITRQVERMGRVSDTPLRFSNPISYLFVDEFQDTDDSQIRFVCRLALALGTRVFAVGDIKQSIYRFRGADYTAFSKFANLVERDPIVDYSLVRNYRTSSSLLENMDRIFARWGKKGWLVYGEDQRLRGVTDTGCQDEWRIESVKKGELRAKATEWIDEALSSVDRGREIAMIVRTNRQAEQLRGWCNQDRPEIPVRLDIGGTFFTCDAVNDFAALIRALLYPGEPQHLFSYLNSSYGDRPVHWTSIVSASGDSESLREILKPYLPRQWDGYIKGLRVQPVLGVIRTIIKDLQPVERYYSRRLQEYKVTVRSADAAEEAAERQACQYRANLDYLFDLIHKKFSGDYVTLHKLERWLTLSQSVDRDVDEPMLPEGGTTPTLRITTVHKAKGLEFDTVIIPFTDNRFRFKTSELLIAKPDQNEGTRHKVGWQIRENGLEIANDQYSRLSDIEMAEIEKEEARLLYVAMTRAERRLWILLCGGKHSWSALLR
jgi:DNA helicase-2/ATP-dependent DNA helicase PcrA